MRREQVLKICANHYITPDMLLKPNAGSDKSWIWNAVDYADEEPRPEQLAIRYKTADEALLFKIKFEEAQKIVPKSPEKQQDQSYRKKMYTKPSAPEATNFAAQFAKKYGEWDCDVCCIPPSFTFGTSGTTSIPAAGFGAQFASSGEQAPDQSDSTPAATSSSPIDLSTKKTSEPDSTTTFTTTTTQDAPNSIASLAFSAVGGEGFSFADLAQNTGGEFAFGKQDSDFSWANAGATLFGAAAPPKAERGEEGSDEEDANNVDIDFEPIVSLPEVETKSGEEDEEILFKERTKLYRWERDLSQWKERGVGDIKILFHPDKRFYRVLMRREQVLKVCANHTHLSEHGAQTHEHLLTKP
ncbi:hypothetical protein J4Q44_G00147420 [Coregonus suidteri]|uniref:RanBD1 domain-containing protein n=1 Tax=Coregonus suidteri TaxID=861788 RepID=A0AAN8QYA1_9TELE